MSVLKTLSEYDKVYPGLAEFKMMAPAILVEAQFVKKVGLMLDPNKDKPGMTYRPTGYFVVIKLPIDDIIDKTENPVSKLKLSELQVGDVIAVTGVSLNPEDYGNHQWMWGDLSKKDRNAMDDEPLTALINPENVVGVVGKLPN